MNPHKMTHYRFNPTLSRNGTMRNLSVIETLRLHVRILSVLAIPSDPKSAPLDRWAFYVDWADEAVYTTNSSNLIAAVDLFRVLTSPNPIRKNARLEMKTPQLLLRGFRLSTRVSR